MRRLQQTGQGIALLLFAILLCLFGRLLGEWEGVAGTAALIVGLVGLGFVFASVQSEEDAPNEEPPPAYKKEEPPSSKPSQD